MQSRLLVALCLGLVVSITGAQQAEDGGELPSLEEIDRQLNNPLSKTWALVLQDNIGIQEGDLVGGSTRNNLLQVTPVIKGPFIK